MKYFICSTLYEAISQKQGKHNSRDQCIFNYRLSLVVENAFGILAQRHLPLSMNNVDKVIHATACLHNYLTEDKDLSKIVSELNPEGHQYGNGSVVLWMTQLSGYRSCELCLGKKAELHTGTHRSLFCTLLKSVTVNVIYSAHYLNLFMHMLCILHIIVIAYLRHVGKLVSVWGVVTCVCVKWTLHCLHFNLLWSCLPMNLIDRSCLLHLSLHLWLHLESWWLRKRRCCHILDIWWWWCGHEEYEARRLCGPNTRCNL